MEDELKEMLTWINENLKAIVTNQEMLYCQLRDIRVELDKQEKP